MWNDRQARRIQAYLACSGFNIILGRLLYLQAMLAPNRRWRNQLYRDPASSSPRAVGHDMQWRLARLEKQPGEDSRLLKTAGYIVRKPAGSPPDGAGMGAVAIHWPERLGRSQGLRRAERLRGQARFWWIKNVLDDDLNKLQAKLQHREICG
ncbi:uncharacterized protein CIMG_06870 [Coccidioides immitis RS]|uniref:Uncharacterized protein n=4 Tax=Coccidioides immitis TaxID=5501 RepID=J3K944_COCIM|nr:uncharacterized protein CIMG_06870 [Coccidioides immitis RS]KMP04032.1 hypothetical protein CIRG_03723 [Coccidioides immitis RMSCC 2394]KMU75007.1 hypothetical protein CISG_00936 [Coccidioides immitis RMSCC 3703]KMU86184.1 hypothetical protein CIHG_03972 [Coccidioides immitis H538.4]TPX24191.1 hypothetical protein DIZ76_013534 [Coccidioides immitis]EAS31391.3 hypothetical protein CIMG_06870 [Coccidioides immitis RS]